MTPQLIAVMGPTGSGKSSLAEALAVELDAQLINADAFQVYKGLDIGTNKAFDKSKYRLLDLIEPTDSFGVGAWVREACKTLELLWTAKRNAVVVGGTGLYIRALLEEYADLAAPPDEEVRAILMNRESSEGLESLATELKARDPDTKVDLRNPARVRRALERLTQTSATEKFKLPPFRRTKIAIAPEIIDLEPYLKRRITSMFDRGWPQEVERLLKKGVPVSAPGFRAIGYVSVAGFLSGETDRKTTEENIFRATRQYAKRQKTWMRSEPGLRIAYTKRLEDEDIMQAIKDALRLLPV